MAMNLFGKRIGSTWYIHKTQADELPVRESTLLRSALELSRVSLDDIDVLKFHGESARISLLRYPGFFTEAFPVLDAYWTVDPQLSVVRYRDLSLSSNPPILHRKELLLSADHSAFSAFAALTEQAEAIGLFDEPHRIGLKLSWARLLESKGYAAEGNELRPLANLVEPTIGVRSEMADPSAEIERHRTALHRSFLSAPVQALFRSNLLTIEDHFFDYGCGRGSDIEGVGTLGIRSNGWDPYFRTDAAKEEADVVNLGFVINVIEDAVERAEALLGAFSLTKRVLCVSAMLQSNMTRVGTPYRDGFRTERNTFQKYFTQGELRDYIEQTLGETAHALGPGIFVVFKDPLTEERFLYRGRRSASRSAISVSRLRPIVKDVSRAGTKQEKAKAFFEEHRTLFERYKEECILIGRIPQDDELSIAGEIRSQIGSTKRAIQMLAEHDYDFEAAMELAASKAKDRLLGFGAKLVLLRKRSTQGSDQGLKRDVQTHFGSWANLGVAARSLLSDLSNLQKLYEACKSASENGFGYLDETDQYHVAVSLLDEVPPLIRAYVECGALLAGNLDSFDAAKIHVRTAKLSLMRYDSFTTSGVPTLTLRLKISLRHQTMETFEYGEGFPAENLYWKSRLIGESSADFERQTACESALDELGLMPDWTERLSVSEFESRLKSLRYELDGYTVRRSTTIPALDDACGSNFRYRDFIECGETWRRLKIDNTPKQPETYNAYTDLAVNLLDPIVEYFGMIKLTYGFASQGLTKHIKGRIAPELDQHAGHELNRLGRAVCPRLGAAVDFLVQDEDMVEVARWITQNLQFDRLYVYAPDKPIHLSHSNAPAGLCYLMRLNSRGNLTPRSFS